MSITFHVDGWADQPSTTTMIPLVEQYTELCNDDFAGHGYDKNSDGLYVSRETFYEDAFPDLNVSVMTGHSMVRLLGLGEPDGGVGEISCGDIDKAIRSCLLVTNVSDAVKPELVPMMAFGNVVDFGVREGSLVRAIKSLHEILLFAKAKGKMVYWC